ncbi:MAG: Sapep family Mn(2+)-dependent dipeptidase [Bacilli bacterium]|jgi:succinyl-diaminopimelate desuccinylase|nr:Sapep family Mn(2+)-dependent dipeptidase [Bacilli bacterium]
MEKKVKTIYASLAKKYSKEALEFLKEACSINSIYDEKTIAPEKPFGEGVDKALKYIADLGVKLGFKAERCDGYASELTYGEGPLIDIYAHMDVVPVSPNWLSDPFTPRIENDVMYARGSADDKGPGIAALYGAKLCLDQGWIKGYKVRVIFGGNEERGSLCLDHYFHKMHKPYPTYGFSPDADYPLIFAEKGIYTYKVDFDLDDQRIPSFKYGQATNVVLDEAYLPLKDSSLFVKPLADYQKNHPEIMAEILNSSLHFKGKASHGSVPWNGVNAGLHLLNFLGEVFNIKVLKEIFLDYQYGDGKNFDGDYKSAYFDSSSYCVGVMSYDGKTLSLLVNMRLPENVEADKAVEHVEKVTHPSCIELLGGSPSLVKDPSSPFIQALLKAYQEETGDYQTKPLAIGGGTYARETENTVAFGMQFPGVDCLMHQDNEFLRLKDFYQSIGIYAHAIQALGELAKEHK